MGEANIVKELKNLEKEGVLYSGNYVSPDFTNESKVVETDRGDDKDNHFYETNNIDDLKKENEELRKKVEELKNRYNSLAEYFEIISDTTIALGQKDLFSDVNDIIFQLTPQGRITYINSAVEEIGNYDSYDLIGQNITDLIPKKDWKKIRKKFSFL